MKSFKTLAKTKSNRYNFSKRVENNEIRNESNEIKKFLKIINKRYLKYETHKYFFYFKQFKTIRSFADGDSNLMTNIIDFNSRPSYTKTKSR